MIGLGLTCGGPQEPSRARPPGQASPRGPAAIIAATVGSGSWSSTVQGTRRTPERGDDLKAITAPERATPPDADSTTASAAAITAQRTRRVQISGYQTAQCDSLKDIRVAWVSR